MTDDSAIQYQTIRPPLSADASGMLIEFWERGFQTSFDWLGKVLSGHEIHSNEDIIYVARTEDSIAATCRLTISRADTKLGLLGEVVTSERCRGKGLARRLCGQALQDFRSENGKALFLGTGNPAAARLYTSLGWRPVAGSNVMLNSKCFETADEFLKDYFRDSSDLRVEIHKGAARHRLPIVPLIISPNDSRTLDANTSIYSTTYANQPSCEGLYLRYAGLHGGWFVAERADGVVVGISSARQTEDGSCCIDAFAHPSYVEKYLMLLYEEAIRFAGECGASSVHAVCSATDSFKKTILDRISDATSLPVREIP